MKNLIVGGCSFSNDGISGSPPNKSPGGCSFFDYPDDNIKAREPSSWVGHVAKSLQVSSLVNLAAPSHGNIMTGYVLPELYRKFDYNPNNTLFLFNISNPLRLDVMTDWQHPDACQYIPWNGDLIPYTFLSRQSTRFEQVQKHIGWQQIGLMNKHALSNLFDFFRANKLQYYFLMMQNYLEDDYIGSIIQDNIKHCISMPEQIGMFEFINTKGFRDADDLHPNAIGHRLIAEQVIKQLGVRKVGKASDFDSDMHRFESYTPCQ